MSVLVVHRPAAGKPYGCPACWRRFRDKRSLRQHAAVHGSPRQCGEVDASPEHADGSEGGR